MVRPLVFTDVQATATKAIATNKYVDKVFNMQGQVVRAGSSSLDGLDKGIYIVNGKKICSTLKFERK
jgi:hypothetical protein